MAQAAVLSGPDFTAGVALASIPAGGVLLGHVGDAPVLLALVDGKPHAVSASCTHYGGPLGEGLRVGDEIRCPWHHACFSLCSGKAVKAPAFAPLDCWKVEVEGARVFVRGEQVAADAEAQPVATPLQNVLIIGGGAAGFACAQRLRERGFAGRITLLSEDSAPPVDRPNLSKDYLAGSAPAEWIPLQPPACYREHGIDLHLDCAVTSLDLRERLVNTAAGERFVRKPGLVPRLAIEGDRLDVLVLRAGLGRLQGEALAVLEAERDLAEDRAAEGVGGHAGRDRVHAVVLRE